MIDHLLYFLTGLVASLIGSMSGLGGGFLAIPTLYYLGLTPRLVVGSSKFMVFVNSVVSTYRYSGKVAMPRRLYAVVVVPMIVSAYIGAYLVAVLPVKALTLIIGLIILVGAVRMIITSSRRTSSGKTGVETGYTRYLVAGLSGFTAGFVAGISGLGGGVVNVPIFIYILRLDPHVAVALSMACIAPSALISLIRHFVDQLIDLKIAVPLSIGALIGGWAGPRLSLGMSREKLRRFIGAVMIIATARILYDALTG